MLSDVTSIFWVYRFVTVLLCILIGFCRGSRSFQLSGRVLRSGANARPCYGSSQSLQTLHAAGCTYDKKNLDHDALEHDYHIILDFYLTDC